MYLNPSKILKKILLQYIPSKCFTILKLKSLISSKKALCQNTLYIEEKRNIYVRYHKRQKIGRSIFVSVNKSLHFQSNKIQNIVPCDIFIEIYDADIISLCEVIKNCIRFKGREKFNN